MSRDTNSEFSGRRGSRARPNRRALVKIEGTALPALAGATRERIRDPQAPLAITLHLRSRERRRGSLERVLDEIINLQRPPLTHKEFKQTFGASPSDLKVVRRFAAAHGFTLGGVSICKRIARLTGPGAALAKAFGVNRVRYRLDDTAWNSFIGSVYLPAELADAIVGVLGFDARPDLRRHGGDALLQRAKDERHGYTALEVAAMYGFPTGLDGRGQRIGVIALGGGYQTSDLRTFFKALDLPMPRIRAKSVDGVRNAPRGPTAQFDGEISGDIETVGAIAPRAEISVYFGPNTSRGFFECVAAAVHDEGAQNNVLSISWGQAEAHWRRSTLIGFDRLLLEAAVRGITVCCSSGDYGSFADRRDRVAHVNYPGSSPYVLSCGGTTLHGKRSRIHSETVWHNATGASGGGISSVFAKPHWQAHVSVPLARGGFEGRGVPDVAANADPLTGYRVFVHGAWHVGAGTSASSPLWAGLIARINQLHGAPIGLPTPHLYKRFAELTALGAVVPITKGNNGLFRARKGWDCCTGVGTPRGSKLAKALRTMLKPGAGSPEQSATVATHVRRDPHPPARAAQPRRSTRSARRD